MLDGWDEGMLDGWDEGLLDGASVEAVEPMDVRKRTTLSFMTVIVWRCWKQIDTQVRM